MMILSQDHETVVETTGRQLFIDDTLDSIDVCIEDLGDDNFSTIGTYKTMEDAKDVLKRIYYSFNSGAKTFQMPGGDDY